MKFLTSTLLVLMLAGCVKEMEVVKIDNRVSNGISVIILNTSRLDNQLRRALTARGFNVPASASINTVTNKSASQDVTFNQAEARYGIRHSGVLSSNNPCFTNGKSWQFTEYTLEVIDLKANQTKMLISKGGRTASCPGSFVDLIQTTDLFGDLADELQKNLI
jgi:hypothetical protein